MYTPNRPTERASRHKLRVSYIELIFNENMTTWVSWQTQPAEIKGTFVGLPSSDLSLIFWVSQAFVSKIKDIGFDPQKGCACKVA